MVFVGDISIVNGVYKPTYNWGAPHCSIYNIIELAIGIHSELEHDPFIVDLPIVSMYPLVI